MQTEQATLSWVIWLAVGVTLAAFLIVALLKARMRRREELGVDKAPPAINAAPEATAQPAPAAEESLPAAPAPILVPAPAAHVEEIAAPVEALDVFEDAGIQRGLAKTHASLMMRLGAMFGRHPSIDQALLDELEEILLTADVGVRLAGRMVLEVKEQLKRSSDLSPDTVKQALKERMLITLEESSGTPWHLHVTQKPYVILFVGVNGVGKTTTIGKIAKQMTDQGHHVVMAAGDTFRAAAAEQLTVWGERSGAKVVRGEAGSDPASVVFNALNHAKQAGADVVLADTAGRLHTKVELMDEIKKVQRALGKARDGAPDQTWLVVDGTTGQNALHQAKEFHEALGLSGVILTKLDGTAKGGVVVAIADALKIPVRFVGVGEQADDLRPFSARAFVHALFDAP